MADAFAATVEDAHLSMALLQSFFMLHRDSAEEACAAAAELRSGALGAERQDGVPMQQHMAQRAIQAKRGGGGGGGGGGAAAVPRPARRLRRAQLVMRWQRGATQ